MKKIAIILMVVIMTSCASSHFYVSALCIDKEIVLDKRGGTNYYTKFKTDDGSIIKRKEMEIYNKSQVGKKTYLEVKKRKFDHINKD